jgi:hypothetical protein
MPPRAKKQAKHKGLEVSKPQPKKARAAEPVEASSMPLVSLHLDGTDEPGCQGHAQGLLDPKGFGLSSYAVPLSRVLPCISQRLNYRIRRSGHIIYRYLKVVRISEKRIRLIWTKSELETKRSRLPEGRAGYVDLRIQS